ncbi:hypothetical protein [Marinobacter sp. JSM 1782161]|uniref:hypothetical protein n=1 Tax=Marinobacter sp. JSM 1782161 TaxID=2685906 RepID=UPI001D19342F|nr:hypothetical protein [Marinobacter sp. JSM 1782161]
MARFPDRCTGFRGFFLITWMLASGWVAAAAEPSTFTDQDVKAFAQEQFAEMYHRAMGDAGERLSAGEPVKAFAVVADRKSAYRTIRISGIEKMPPNVAVEVMRRSLRVLVKKGSIGATCLVYVAENPNAEGEADHVLVAEMEHIFGPTLAQVTPYTLESGKARFGEPLIVESEPSIFNIELKARDEVSFVEGD